jgi:hypothetical protein
VSGVDGDSLLASLPAVDKDLAGQIDQDCG